MAENQIDEKIESFKAQAQAIIDELLVVRFASIGVLLLVLLSWLELVLESCFSNTLRDVLIVISS